MEPADSQRAGGGGPKKRDWAGGSGCMWPGMVTWPARALCARNRAPLACQLACRVLELPSQCPCAAAGPAAQANTWMQLGWHATQYRPS